MTGKRGETGKNDSQKSRNKWLRNRNKLQSIRHKKISENKHIKT